MAGKVVSQKQKRVKFGKGEGNKPFKNVQPVKGKKKSAHRSSHKKK